MITLTGPRQTREVFRHLRQGRGLTQANLARAVHVTPPAIGMRERGERGLPIDTLIDTARAFGFTVALLPIREPNRRPTGTGWPA
jgi:transcriptional regulator with XRE-family HTH domain